MIINDLHVEGVSVGPSKTDAPLVVDANAVLTLSPSLQGLEPVRRRNCQIAQIHGAVKKFELFARPLLDTPIHTLHELTAKNRLSFLGPKGADHAQLLT
jgi:hypothetical protein